MNPSDFTPGTRFFVSDGDPFSISPGAVASNFFLSPAESLAEISNWWSGKPIVVPASEFARSSPPSKINFEEFAERVRKAEAQSAD